MVRTVGKILADGTMVELVSAQPRSARLSLLARRGKRGWSGRRLVLEGRLYRPADIPRSVLRNMYLPARSVNYGSTRSLFDGLVQLFEQRLRLPAREARVCTHFVIATFFTDVLRVAPCVVVATADAGRAAQLLEVLGASCRHALTLADLQVGAAALPRGLYPTLVLSQTPFSSAGIRSLLASQRRGFGILQAVGVADSFCAKAIVVDEETPEQLLAMPCAEIYLAPDQDAPVVDDALVEETAATFQPRLLDYRLRNFLRCASQHSTHRRSRGRHEKWRALSAPVSLMTQTSRRGQLRFCARRTRPRAVLGGAGLIRWWLKRSSSSVTNKIPAASMSAT